MAARLLNWLGTVWLCVAGFLLIVGHGTILVKYGFWRLAETLSPFNIWNYSLIIAILAPGIGAKLLAERLRQR